MTQTLPTLSDVLAADIRIRPYALETPLLRHDRLDELSGGQIFVKAECLQPRGAFKIRGAANAMMMIAPEDRKNGVVAFSSGNHAQGIAYMAKLLGMDATIVVPSDAPKGKLESVRRDGATIVTYDRVKESREEIGAALAAERGATLVEPFDNVNVIAGQGTCGLEIVRQIKGFGLEFDDVVVCASGGGLAAGIALGVQSAARSPTIILSEPLGHDDFGQSLASGKRVSNEAGIRSIQDALLTQIPGELTFQILSVARASAVSVSDDEALHAMAFAFKYLRIVLEPGGAAALAGVLSGKVKAQGRVIAVTASGGNVDPGTFIRALAIPV